MQLITMHSLLLKIESFMCFLPSVFIHASIALSRIFEKIHVRDTSSIKHSFSTKPSHSKSIEFCSHFSTADVITASARRLDV